MKETRQILDARDELEEALRLMDDADTKIQSLPADVSEEERDFHKNTFKRAEGNVAEAREKLERAIAIQKAREAVPPMGDDEPGDAEQRKGFGPRVVIGNEPQTYRADNAHELSFFRDVYFSQKGDPKAQERLSRHQMETRDVSTADPGAGVFMPPVYLGDMWAELPRESRPFATAIRNMPLPPSGTSFTVPRLTTGVSVASQSGEATAPSETDADDLPRVASGNRFTATPEEMRAIYLGAIAYYGRYAVDEGNGTLALHIEVSNFPNWSGTAEKRLIAMTGDEMRLINPSPPTGGTSYIVWKRAR